MKIQIEHYLQVVKTEVVSRRFGQEHSVIEEYEYTAHSSVAHGYYYPVAKFRFDLSPMQVSLSAFDLSPVTNVNSYSPLLKLPYVFCRS